MPDYELYHYGVKGMKWGVRRTAAQLGHLISTSVKKRSEKREAKKASKKAEKEAERLKRKPTKALTDEELKQRIARLNMEQEYNKLLKSTDSTARGKAAVADMFENAAKNIGTQTMAYLMGVGVNKLAKDAFGIKNAKEVIEDATGKKVTVDVFKDIVNPRKGQKD